jgi:hypothetical protein
MGQPDATWRGQHKESGRSYARYRSERVLASTVLLEVRAPCLPGRMVMR